MIILKLFTVYVVLTIIAIVLIISFKTLQAVTYDLQTTKPAQDHRRGTLGRDANPWATNGAVSEGFFPLVSGR